MARRSRITVNLLTEIQDQLNLGIPIDKISRSVGYSGANSLRDALKKKSLKIVFYGRITKCPDPQN